MGTRGQVFVKDTGIYLYQHFDAYDLPNVVKRALKRGKDRWDDEEYLTRIIFNQMTAGSEKDLLGYGIGTQQHGDIEYLVVIDIAKQTVAVRHMTWDGDRLNRREFTFQEFVDDKNDNWEE